MDFRQEKRDLKKGYREQISNLKLDYKEQKSDRKNEGNVQYDQFKQEHKDQKEQLKQDYKEQKQKINDLRVASMTNVRGRIKSHLSGFLRALVVGLLVLVQIAIIILLPFLLREYTVYFYVVLVFFSFVVALNLTNANKNTSYKVAWLSIALLLPVSGHIMYFLWGRNGTRKRLIEKTKSRIAESYPFIIDNKEVSEKFYKDCPEAKRISKYMNSEKFPLYSNNEVKYYSMGEDVFEDLFEDLLKAKKYIFINFFIVAEGALLDLMLEILTIKAKEGVEIVFIYDDFGAMLRTDKDFCQKLKDIGINALIFNPIYKYTDKLIMNYRTHQKIVVIDGEVGYTGGFNLADEYANLIERFGVWKDCGIRIEGDAVWGLATTFLQMWSICEPDRNMKYMKYKAERTFAGNECYCHVLSDGPIRSDAHVIESVYKQMIADADEYVYIMTPYLILEEHMIQTLVEAVRRNVDVRILTPHIPDKKTVKQLTDYNYGPLLKGGVKIYEYTPGFVHSKVILNDFSAVVGTANMDYRSFYLHYENAVWVSEDNIRNDIRNDFMNTFAISSEISYNDWLNRPLKDKVLQPLMNLFSTLV